MRGIVRRFPGVVALGGVDLEVQPGEVHVLAGENGAGKSTLMRILAGAESRDEGTIEIDGAAVDMRTPAEAIARGVAVVYQELSLCAHLTVAENLFLGREPLAPPRVLRRIDRQAMRTESRRLFDRLGAGDIDPDRPCGELSLAQRQLVEIARALLRDVRILVLDEPTASLAEAEQKKLFQAVRGLRERGVAVVYISHRLEEYAAIGDRVTVLKEGKVTWRGTVAEATVDVLVRAMAGRDVGELFPREPRPPGETLLRVKGLSARRGLREASPEISFDLRAGEIVGVVGLMGSGRSVLLRLLFGLETGAAGTVELPPSAPRAPFASPGEAIAAGLGYCPEERRRQGLCLNLGVGTNLTLAALDRIAGRVARLGHLDLAEEERLAADAALRLGIRTASLAQPVAGLSGGNQQKVVLGRWLLRGARVILLDEPARGIDVGAKVEVFRLMTAWAKEGKAVLFVSSYLPEVLGMADRVLVMHRGHLVADRPAAGMTEEEALHLASVGRAQDAA
jgi:ABC-type sugar transport system ATPase subunit